MKFHIKFILAAALLAAAGLAANAQISVQAGTSLPYQKMTQHDPSDRYARGGIGAYAGVDYDIHIIKGCHITPGLYYGFTQVSHSEAESGIEMKETQTDHLISIPVHLKYAFNIKPDKFGLYLYAGPVFSLSAASRLKGRVNGFEENIDVYIDNHTGAIKNLEIASLQLSDEEKQTIIDEVQPTLDSQGITQRHLDLQVDCGVGFMFRKHWELRLGYSFGVFDRFNRDYGDNHDLKMTQYYVGFGYRF